MGSQVPIKATFSLSPPGDQRPFLIPQGLSLVVELGKQEFPELSPAKGPLGSFVPEELRSRILPFWLSMVEIAREFIPLIPTIYDGWTLDVIVLERLDREESLVLGTSRYDHQEGAILHLIPLAA